MAERVDVLIAGSGFGGSISAYRLAELYRAAGASAHSILVLERGKRYGHTDFKQSMHIDHLSSVYELIQGQGAQVVTANAVGGGSNLYLAASLRAPSEIFERRDRRPGDGPARRMWPRAISRHSLDPYYARAERGLRVHRPSWNEVSKSGGLWAANLNAAGHTCDRVPLAISPKRCVNAKWCHTGCIFGAKNSLITNYLASAERMGVRVRPNVEVQSIRQSSARPYRYVVTVAPVDNLGAHPSRQASSATYEVECKALVLATGAMGNPAILMRSSRDLPSLSAQVGRHLGINGDHVAAIEYDPRRVQRVLGLPPYHDFHKGKPITTMSYDFYVGRRSHRYDGTRFTLQEIFLSSLTNFLYDDGRRPGGDPSWWGLQKKQAIARWASRIELLAMVEDTHDGTFYAPPTSGGSERPNAGPVCIGTFNYSFSEQSLRVRRAADAAIARVARHRGLGRFMKLTETEGGYAAHPLGGCRMAEHGDLGVVDHSGRVFGYEGLHCIDSSIVPSSLGVNPSLTIAALSERCAERLVASAGDLGLPRRPKHFRPGTPREIVGHRVVPHRPHHKPRQPAG
ncbi:MAG: enediyne biosynthesis protein [Solirubrobacteraceae bacterium]|jgi:choline dehydrogenase-like flavoprotein|nr:enediyne biosynthesis protein [Solirubrobacteraceae bacterium]